MWRVSFCIFIYLGLVSGFDKNFCRQSQQTASCATQIIGQNNISTNWCRVESLPEDNPECQPMGQNGVTPNDDMGRVNINLYLFPNFSYSDNYTMLNISFTNIQWKKMRFSISRSQSYGSVCKKFVISDNVSIAHQSLLVYDCLYTIAAQEQAEHYDTLHFEASDGKETQRSRYFFYIPSIIMLSPTVKESEWKPFTYIQMLPAKMRLHVVPPLPHLNITDYRIKVLQCHDNDCTKIVQSDTLKTEPSQEVTYDFDYSKGEYNASYIFDVTPLHAECEEDERKCQTVQSPQVPIEMEVPWTTLIVTVSTLVVAFTCGLYMLWKYGTRRCCTGVKPIHDDPSSTPPKILAVYPVTNRSHAKCVTSFVNLLRKDIGLDVMHYPDINKSENGDPLVWAIEAFANATHFMYIVGPGCDGEITSDSDTFVTYDYFDPRVYRNLDGLLLSYLQQSRAENKPKTVSNVYFDYSKDSLPHETRHNKEFHLLKHWNKLIIHFSKDLVPSKETLRTENGMRFLNDLGNAIMETKKRERWKSS